MTTHEWAGIGCVGVLWGLLIAAVIIVGALGAAVVWWWLA